MKHASLLSMVEGAESSAPRVLFITRKWGPAVGGMETYCERLCEELDKLHPIEVIALKGRANGQPPATLSLLLFPITVLLKLIGLRHRPAIVHLGDMAIWPLGLLAKLRNGKVAMILSAHGTDVAYGARGGLKGTLYSIYLRLGAKIMRNAQVIANSRATSDRLNSIGWPVRAVVPLATDLYSEPMTLDEPLRLVFAGRLVARKGCSWFVREVLPLLPKETRLSVIGTRWDEKENTALNHPQVEFLGPLLQARLAEHFASATCVIVPNIELENGEYEGFGLVAPEAAGAGAVVLAARCGGLCDAVIDSETGYLLPVGDAEAWAAKIIEIAAWSTGRRSAFIANSQRTVASYYSWQRVAAETAAAYAVD